MKFEDIAPGDVYKLKNREDLAGFIGFHHGNPVSCRFDAWAMNTRLITREDFDPESKSGQGLIFTKLDLIGALDKELDAKHMFIEGIFEGKRLHGYISK